MACQIFKTSINSILIQLADCADNSGKVTMCGKEGRKPLVTCLVKCSVIGQQPINLNFESMTSPTPHHLQPMLNLILNYS